MSKFWAGLGGNAGAVAAGAVVVTVLATGVWISNTRESAEITQPAALLQPAQEDAQSTELSPKGANKVPEATAQSDAQPPAFDEVRREPDGMTVVAGRAAPGAKVQLLRNGDVIASAVADGSGKFATLAMIAPDGRAHILTLSQRVNEDDIASLDEVILAPTQRPAAMAEAGPEGDVASAIPETVVAKAAPEDVATQTTSETTKAQVGPETKGANPVAVLKSTAEGVELLNPSAPSVMDTVALDTISYSNIGDVQLAGRAQQDTKTVRVYLDNDAVITLPVDDQGRWRGDVPDVDEGIYTLRLDEVGADGTVTSRIETPFKRESAAVLSQASTADDGPIKAITVQAGATLWAIARDRYGDGQLYLRVFEANAGDIRDPDLIYPGQVFDLPD